MLVSIDCEPLSLSEQAGGAALDEGDLPTGAVDDERRNEVRWRVAAVRY